MTQRPTFNILISGVGGQGVVLASYVLSRVALAEGYDVKQSEVHGMAQRGGCVTSHLRFGDQVYSSLITPGTVDVLLAFESVEAMRYVHWLKPGGHLVVEVPNVEATCQAPAHSFHRAHLTTWGVPTLERLGLQAGLQPTRAWVSEDGGNIEVVFRRDTAAPSDATAPHSRTRDYAGKVEKILRSHTALGHYLSGQPLRRLAARLRKRTEERRLTRDAHDPRRILDNLIRQSGAAVSPATPTT